MVQTQIRRRGLTDPRLLEAFRKVPRHRFVPPIDWDEAYDDHPLPIGCGQTISQPYIVAYMTDRLRVEPGMKVLEVGTGSGYQAAILAEMGAVVYTIERHAQLSQSAQRLLEELGYRQIHFRIGDGTLGWPEEAPFDRILVTAAGPSVPESLKQQLAEGGRLIIPVGSFHQELQIVTRKGKEFRTEHDLGVIFVRLIGKEGFSE